MTVTLLKCRTTSCEQQQKIFNHKQMIPRSLSKHGLCFALTVSTVPSAFDNKQAFKILWEPFGNLLEALLENGSRLETLLKPGFAKS